jgi:uncharacterized membrane protein YeaQ/YmgE (transglycosylase-associated protein family)
MSINIGQLVIWLITGALAGYIVGVLLRRRGFGPAGNVLIGLVGAVVGGLLFQLLGIQFTDMPTFTFSLADLLVAIIGALVLVVVLGLVTRR